MLDRPAIQHAARRLSPHVRRTPILQLDPAEFGFPVTLKLEFLQHTGSFKARGAFNRLLNADTSAGVVAASGGNHGAAVAYAARALGIPARIFVPTPTPETKCARIAAYGADLIRSGANYAEALAASQAWGAANAALEVHAYDHPDILAGQGTVALELEAADPMVTHVLVAVGGGGLFGGIASWFAGTPTQVVAVEPITCPTLHHALQAGHPVPVEVGGRAADSLGAREVGTHALAVAQANATQSLLVEDNTIMAAQAWLWDRLRIVAEPGGACALAPLLTGSWTPPEGSRVAVILCGANTDPATISRL